MKENLSWIRRLSFFGTWFTTLLGGVKVGEDVFGNSYYKSRRTRSGQRERRWVIFKGEPEPTKVPPEWHIWLHHIANDVLAQAEAKKYPWMKSHEPNLTGTVAAWFPPGYTLAGGRRDSATGDYQSWQPQE